MSIFNLSFVTLSLPSRENMFLTSGSPKIQISSLTSRRKPDQRNPIKENPIKENNAIVSKDDPLLLMRDNNPLMSITSGCAVYQTRSSMGGGGGGEGGHSTKFYTERLRPEVQTLTLLYTIFDRKGTPCRIPSTENGTPFIYLRSDFYQTFHVRNPLKYLDESAVRCVCSKYFESPF